MKSFRSAGGAITVGDSLNKCHNCGKVWSSPGTSFTCFNCQLKGHTDGKCSKCDVTIADKPNE